MWDGEVAPVGSRPPVLFWIPSIAMTRKLNLFGIRIDPLTMSQTLRKIRQWIEHGHGTCRFVVTPNVDHLVMLRLNPCFQRAYDDAALVLADGRPVVWASRILRRPIPMVVPGSDLVPSLFASSTAQSPIKAFLLGAGPGVADRAAVKIRAQWPTVEVVGTYSPPLHFESNEEENRSIVERINRAAPNLLVIGLGAPKQELWIQRHRSQIKAPVALCVGATIDFLSGERHRAPLLMRRLGLEWLHRMTSEPKRMIPRYARDAWFFPQMVFMQWWKMSVTSRSVQSPD